MSRPQHLPSTSCRHVLTVFTVHLASLFLSRRPLTSRRSFRLAVSFAASLPLPQSTAETRLSITTLFDFVSSRPSIASPRLSLVWQPRAQDARESIRRSSFLFLFFFVPHSLLAILSAILDLIVLSSHCFTILSIHSFRYTFLASPISSCLTTRQSARLDAITLASLPTTTTSGDPGGYHDRQRHFNDTTTLFTLARSCGCSD